MSESFYRVYNSCYAVFTTDCDCSALHKMPNWRKTFCMNETSSKRSEEGREPPLNIASKLKPWYSCDNSGL